MDKLEKEMAERAFAKTMSDMIVRVEQLERNAEMVLAKEVAKQFEGQFKAEVAREFVRRESLSDLE
jgi:citrate lyase gamma subunit